MVSIIFKSHGDPVESWPISPAVYLAIVSVTANILLRYTFARGVETSWWVTALNPTGSTTVKDLHNIWLYSTSLRSALLSGRSFNLVALTSILLALVPANAPLAQRASQTALHTSLTTIPLSINALPTFNIATGAITGRGHTVSFITPSFASTLQSYLVSAPIPLRPSTPSCATGLCKGTLRAAGYAMSCTNATETFDKTSTAAADLIASNFTSSDGTSAFEDAVVFGTAISYGEKSGFQPGEAVMNLSVTVKEKVGCKGLLAIRKCALVPATLAYRVVVSNNTVRLDEGYTFADDVVEGHYFTPGSSSGI